jgi:uncharacterized protein with FMN-binding domain
MKRGILIGVGTLGSLGAVLSITPPQFGTSTSASGGLSGGATTSGGTTSTPAPAATQAAPSPSASATNSPAATTSAASTATKKATPKATATKKSTPAPTKSAAAAAPTPTPTKTSTPTPTPAQTQAQSAGASGTFTGSTFPANEYGRNWGDVHVVVTFKNGIISSITGSQNPSSRGYMAFSAIDPYVAGQKISIATIKSKSASALPYVGGATYSSMAYWESLKTAINQAGL